MGSNPPALYQNVYNVKHLYEKSVTASGWFKALSTNDAQTSTFAVIVVFTDLTDVRDTITIPTDDTWHYYTLSVDIPPDKEIDYVRYVATIDTSGTALNTLYIADACLYEGNLALPYQENPVDYFNVLNFVDSTSYTIGTTPVHMCSNTIELPVKSHVFVIGEHLFNNNDNIHYFDINLDGSKISLAANDWSIIGYRGTPCRVGLAKNVSAGSHTVSIAAFKNVSTVDDTSWWNALTVIIIPAK